MRFSLISIFCYLLGSIPFGLLIGKIFAKLDVRQYGSGNIGTTNVLRTAGYLPAVLTLIGDLGKGFLAVLLSFKLTGSPLFSLFAGFLAVIGHNWPIFLGFKGGKGVATIAGVLLAYKPLFLIILAIVWIVILVRTRYISLASISVAILFPVLALLFRLPWLELALAITLGVFTVFRHRSNIVRLREGREFKIGEKVS